jgi:hypothetical protein
LRTKTCLAFLIAAFLTADTCLFAKALELEVPDGMSKAEEQSFVDHKMSLYKEAVIQADKKILVGKYLSLGGVAVLGLDFFAGVLLSPPQLVTTSGSMISRGQISACLAVAAYLGAAMIPAGFIVMGLGNLDKEHALEKLQITPVPFSGITGGYPVYGMKMEFRF